MRADLADIAEHTLDLQYYALHEDTTTQLLVDRVVRAARRGVRVRLLVDDLFAVGNDLHLAELAAGPNIEVRVFNPFMRRGPFGVSRLFEFIGDTTRLNRRMHNKLWIADNAAAIIGGRNLGDAYFDIDTAFNFCDLDMLAVGPVVQELSRSFDKYWNSPWAVPISAFVAVTPDMQAFAEFERTLDLQVRSLRDTAYARALAQSDAGALLIAGEWPLTPAPAIALYDLPSDDGAGNGVEPAWPPVASGLRGIIEGAELEVVLISPYFIPSEQGIDVLSAAIARGVRVRILTNSLASTDMPVVHAGYARLRPRLLSAGVELYEMRPDGVPHQRQLSPPSEASAKLHTKAIVVDRRQVLVGSMNVDPRSRHINTEVAVLINSAVVGEELITIFDEAVQPTHAYRLTMTEDGSTGRAINWTAIEGGESVRHDTEPASAWRQMQAEFLFMFTPDDLL